MKRKMVRRRARLFQASPILAAGGMETDGDSDRDQRGASDLANRAEAALPTKKRRPVAMAVRKQIDVCGMARLLRRALQTACALLRYRAGRDLNINRQL